MTRLGGGRRIPMGWKDVDVNENLPIIEFAFPGALRDKLIAAIESGNKTLTSALLRGYEMADEPTPHIGRRDSVVDSAGEHRLIIETTAVELVPLRDVPLAHALAEGEGYESVAEWRAGHMNFWTSDEVRAELGPDFEVNDDTVVVLENFAVVR